MKISKTAIITLFSSGASFSLSLKATQEGYESSPCNWCCVIEPPQHLPFLGFEYWFQFGVVLFVLSFGFAFAALKILFEDNRKSDVLHITPPN
jgi:hypothetical protein